MKTLLILLVLGLLAGIASAAVRLRRGIDKDSLDPSEVGLISEGGYDESFQLDNILKQTWEYFDAHPGTSELTEIHSLLNDNACQVFEESGESGEKITVLLFSISESSRVPDYLDVEGGLARMEFKGVDARREVKPYIEDVLQLSDESRSPYLLAGSDGPVLFFER